MAHFLSNIIFYVFYIIIIYLFYEYHFNVAFSGPELGNKNNLFWEMHSEYYLPTCFLAKWSNMKTLSMIFINTYINKNSLLWELT